MKAASSFSLDGEVFAAVVKAAEELNMSKSALVNAVLERRLKDTVKEIRDERRSD